MKKECECPLCNAFGRQVINYFRTAPSEEEMIREYKKEIKDRKRLKRLLEELQKSKKEEK